MSNKVSCICITNNRVASLKNAVNCFAAQTYNNKELVILYREEDIKTKKFLSALDVPGLLLIEIDSQEKISLGEMRNRAIRQSSGDFFCVWDDDDWYHEDRITLQMEAIAYHKKKAAILFFLILYDYKEKKSYLSHARPWEPSILCSKKLLEENNLWYADLDKCEDKDFIKKLVSLDVIAPLANPRLYLYACTGVNTSGRDHFVDMFSYSVELSEYQSHAVTNIFNNEMALSEAVEMLNSEKFLSTIPLIPRYFNEI